MERFLDISWEYIYATILHFAGIVDSLLSPVQSITGPAFILVLLALLTVFCTKFLSKKCRTKRHKKLEEDFYHWLNVREEAMRCEDREKGSRMAKNIDKAKLNRCYYDYFFEGLLLGLATTYLPILMVMSYVNSFFRPEKLMELTGREYIMQFGSSGGEPVLIGSIFFYLVSLVSFYLAWALLKKGIERHRKIRIINEVNNKQAATAR
ncbi:MAG: hypothetical protein JKY62_09905 [Desulfocapsa sp.]|nr:hypothetical protein [Desulfocapsa sp.]